MLWTESIGSIADGFNGSCNLTQSLRVLFQGIDSYSCEHREHLQPSHIFNASWIDE